MMFALENEDDLDDATLALKMHKCCATRPKENDTLAIIPAHANP